MNSGQMTVEVFEYFISNGLSMSKSAAARYLGVDQSTVMRYRATDGGPSAYATLPLSNHLRRAVELRHCKMLLSAYEIQEDKERAKQVRLVKRHIDRFHSGLADLNRQ